MSDAQYRFEVAISFAGDNKREVVRSVSEILRDRLGRGKVFFDEWFEAELAGPDAQIVLQNYYGRLSRLVVACVCQRYNDKPWTQEEWRAIQAFERQLRDAGTDNTKRMRFLPLRFGDGEIDGLFATAIVPDVRNRTPQSIAELIIERLNLCKGISKADVTTPQEVEPKKHVQVAATADSEQQSVQHRDPGSKEFLHLLALVQKAIAPHGAKVTESALVKAPGFGGLREIDVLLESQIGPFTMKVAFEANDHGRKLDVTDVEAIIGKYRSIGGLIVDRVVLVSRRGFSIAATQKAAQNGIRLLTLKEANQADWVEFFPKEYPVLPQKIKLEIKPHVAQLEVKLLGLVQPPSDAPNLCRILCRCHRTDFGSPVQFANHVLNCHLLRNNEFVSKLNEHLKSNESFCSRIGWPMANFLLKHSGGELEVAQLKFHVHATRAEAPLKVTGYELEGDDFEKQLVQHATADIAGRTVNFVMPDGMKSKQIIMEFGECKKDPRKRQL